MREPRRRPGGDREVRCVCELVGLLYAACRAHGKRARFALAARKHQVGRLRFWFPRTPVGVRYLSREEVLRLADRMVDRERRAAVMAVRPVPDGDRSPSAPPARIQGREANITAKRCEP